MKTSASLNFLICVSMLLVIVISKAELPEDIAYLFTRGGLVFDILDKANDIKVKTDTLKIGLDSTNIAPDGTIALTSTGTYILLENLMCNIAITGVNITLDLAGKSVIGTVAANGSALIIKNGAIVALPPVIPVMATVPALHVQADARSVLIKNCHIECLSSLQTSTEVDQIIAGRHAVRISGHIIDMHDCSIGAGTSVNTTTTTALDGGTAIIIDGTANKVRIFDTIMVSGDGGSAVIGDAGNGGHGIWIKDTANHIEIKNCTIFETGAGGTANGNGGHGIIIEENSADVCIHDCHIRNTGAGAGSGVGGKAIQDAVTITGNYSIIYRNIAHNIANSLKFDLQGLGVEKGIQSPLPPDNSAINQLVNIYFS